MHSLWESCVQGDDALTWGEGISDLDLTTPEHVRKDEGESEQIRGKLGLLKKKTRFWFILNS